MNDELDQNGVPVDPVKRKAFFEKVREYHREYDLHEHNEEIEDQKRGWAS